MDPIQPKLKKLKELLIDEEDFHATFDYFFNHVANEDQFMENGKKCKHPFIKKVLKEIGKQLFHTDVTIADLLIIRYGKTKFYHGACFIQNRMSCFFFFDDITMGMSCIHLPSGESTYSRITGKVITGKQLFMNPEKGKKTLH